MTPFKCVCYMCKFPIANFCAILANNTIYNATSFFALDSFQYSFVVKFEHGIPHSEVIIRRQHLGDSFLVVFGLEIVQLQLVQVWNVVRVKGYGRQEPHGYAESVQDSRVVFGTNVGIAEEGFQRGQDESLLGWDVQPQGIDQRFLIAEDQFVGVVCSDFDAGAGVQEVQNVQNRGCVPHGLKIDQLDLIVAFVEHQVVDPGVTVAEHLPRFVAVSDRRGHNLVETTI